MFLSKLFKRNTEAKEHVKNNRGDENVTKMIWVVTVFVVGALLLTIVSGAFSGKVAGWYNDTLNSWFNESNGMYSVDTQNNGGNIDTSGEPAILDGANQTLSITTHSDLTVRSSAPLSEFQGVTVNGEVVPSDQYRLTEGSTIVTLNESYLSTLNVGTYDISIVSNSGTATTSFTLIGDEVVPEGAVCYAFDGVTQNCKTCGKYDNVNRTQCPNCGYVYTVTATLVVYEAGDIVPDITEIDYMTCGDYKYTNLNVDGCIWVEVLDKTKSQYGNILSVIFGKPVTVLTSLFAECPNLTSAPMLPSTITDLQNTFRGCSKLKTYNGSLDADGDFSNYAIPESIKYMSQAFEGCVLMTKAPTIHKNICNIGNVFNGCSNLTGPIIIEGTPTTIIDALRGTKVTEILGACINKKEILATR